MYIYVHINHQISLMELSTRFMFSFIIFSSSLSSSLPLLRPLLFLLDLARFHGRCKVVCRTAYPICKVVCRTAYPICKLVCRTAHPNCPKDPAYEIHRKHSELTVYKWTLQHLARVMGDPWGLEMKPDIFFNDFDSP